MVKGVCLLDVVTLLIRITQPVWHRSTMEVKQFLGLQVFEFAYLMALAFFPFFIAQREVAITILMVASVYVVFSVIKHALSYKVDPANKVVIITGCDTGFGNSLAQRLDSLGFTVIAGCLDKSSDGAEQLKSSTSGRLHVIPLDVTDDTGISNCLSFFEEELPGKDLWALVNNAGIIVRGDVEFTSVKSYQKVADVNLFGTIRMTKAFLPHLRKHKGRIINVSGASGCISLPSLSAYSISNYGIEAFSDALRLEMKQFGVKVIIIEPGNYYGSTGLQNRAALPGIQKAFAALWAEAPETVRQAYGKGYIDSQYKAVAEQSKTSASSLAPVIDILELAIMQVNAKPRYLISGSNQIFDYLNVLLWWKPWLPERIFDKLVENSYCQRAPAVSN
ncbi:D-beta-hydroxybutyrate dehydrogenase, mitochondrial-like isoform X2 [Pomacea canaliculata]|uniref:D-beta-hydroxybutyrate dehydrogenase, mitochondrial-like isoform X2 n=1 Tax=Pomacea canaliculata TaxID=400727 RepID=UPI000D733FBB|nr:D-beta-hydroxybutyrate dehydrogenase, mitochondrial-like isoform X2 [Pomacea canaliculata]